MSEMLTLRGLRVRYPGQETDAVRGVSFALQAGSLAGLVGESGSGKTTIVSAILGLLPDGSRTAGEIEFCGCELRGLDEREMRRLRWKEIALVPQGAQNSFTPVKTIGAHITETLRVHLGLPDGEARERAAALLEQAELDAGVARRYPHELSGGQKQRAAIALALACDPRLLLADEPTTALDVITQAGILRLLTRLRREKHLTALLVTHDLPLAASICDELFVMKDGALVERGTPRQIIYSPKEAYTRRLVESIL